MHGASFSSLPTSPASSSDGAVARPSSRRSLQKRSGGSTRSSPSSAPSPAATPLSGKPSARLGSRRFLPISSAGYATSATGLPAKTDRKSVVSGKGVAVRVALGGPRILKKKTKHAKRSTKIIDKDQIY